MKRLIFSVFLSSILLFNYFQHGFAQDSATFYYINILDVQLRVLSYRGQSEHNLTVQWQDEIFFHNFDNFTTVDVTKVSEQEVIKYNIVNDGIEVPIIILAGFIPLQPKCVLYNKMVDGKNVFRLLISAEGNVSGSYGDGVFGWNGQGSWDHTYTEYHLPKIILNDEPLDCSILIDYDLFQSFYNQFVPIVYN